jgi:hypothetical protein
MKFLRADRSCPVDAASRQAILRQVSQLGPTLAVGQTIQLKDRSASRYLGKGWAQQEPWGVWSDSERANLVFLPRSSSGADGLQLHVAFRSYIRPSVGQQTISVSVNGRPVDTWTITNEMLNKGCCERTIPLGRAMNPTDEIDVTFDIHDPRNPGADREIVDSRRLGFGLQSMSLTASASEAR